MMTIIEKEIERREVLIAEKAVKEQKIAEMQAEIDKLSVEVAETDEYALLAEIDELKAYLPKEDTADELVGGETDYAPEFPTNILN